VLFLATLGIQLLGSIYYGGWAVLLWFLLLGPVLLLTVLIHELGHCLAARSVVGPIVTLKTVAGPVL
jgi:membrane-associated protease RseP (regulator of RpoE activity)